MKMSNRTDAKSVQVQKFGQNFDRSRICKTGRNSKSGTALKESRFEVTFRNDLTVCKLQTQTTTN